MLAGKMLLQRLLQLGFSLLFLMAPACNSRLLPLPGARGCSAGSAAAAGCGWGGRGCALVQLCWVGTPHVPGDVVMAGAGSVCRSCTGLGGNRCLKQPHDPDSPGALCLWGPLRTFPASGVLAAVEHLLPGTLPPCFGADSSPSHRLPRACPLLSGWTEP